MLWCSSFTTTWKELPIYSRFHQLTNRCQHYMVLHTSPILPQPNWYILLSGKNHLQILCLLSLLNCLLIVFQFQPQLNQVEELYSSLSPRELMEDKPSVGLPCVVQYNEDKRFYRSQILSIRDQVAKVLFVDYGNEQDTPLSELKRIIPRFMELPQLVSWFILIIA